MDLVCFVVQKRYACGVQEYGESEVRETRKGIAKWREVPAVPCLSA